jgi:TolB protein
MKNCLFFLYTLSFFSVAHAQIPEGKKVQSSLYIYNMITKESLLVTRENRHFEAPNWAPNGTYLLLNSNGKIEKYSLKGEALGEIDTGELSKNNNDHGISFDGKTLFFSGGQNEIKMHSSFIYKVPLKGGQPKLLTPLSPSYWHGVSPDGETIVYCAERNGNYDVYKISASGGEEIRLTTAEGLDDGPEYSPDGKYIYFNSFRTGKMQIWRMLTDGSNKEQMTFDNYSNWFVHIAPHNQNAVIISYIEDQGQQHPFGRQVKLRLLDLSSKKMSDLTATFYRGQGTINVPSWNPEGTQFLYVTYALID